MERELIPISALEHWSYCPRQCGLIHLEQTFSDNVYTVRGSQVHERAHEEGGEAVDGGRAVRGMPLWSDRLGLIGKADVVEFRGKALYPVEYKVGRRVGGHEDLQLAAQAMCLEEMLDVDVPEGAVFYHSTRRRHRVRVDDRLREVVEHSVAGVRSMLETEQMPDPIDDARCPRCSLLDVCVPSVVAHRRRVKLLYSSVFRVED